MPDDGVLRIGTQVNLGPLREAEAAVKAASANMASAQLEFGKAAEQGNQQAAEALKVYQTELRSAESALAAFTGTEERETVALRSNITARMAASAELRVLEGSFVGSTRAAGAFLSSLPGVGTALQAAFPVFGAVALLGVLAQMTEKVVKLTEDFDGLRKISDEAWAAALEAEGKGIELSEQHNRLLREQQVLQAELAGGKAGRQNRGEAAGSAYDLNQAKNDLAIITGQIDVKRTQLDDLNRRAGATTTTIQGRPGGMGPGLETTQPTEDAKLAQARLPQVNEELNNALQEQKNLQLQIADATQKTLLFKREETEKVDSAALRNAAQIVALYREVDEQNFRIAEQQREINNQVLEYHARLAEATDKANDPAVMEQIKRQSSDILENLKQQTEQYRLQDEARIKAASEQYRGVEQSTQSQVQSGTMLPQQRIAILQAAAAQEYAVQLDAIQKKEALDIAYLDKYQQDLDQQTALTQAYYQKQQQLAQQAAQQMLQPYQQFFNQVSQQFSSFVDSQLTGTQRLGAAFQKLGDQIALDAINGLLAWGEKQIATEGLVTAQHLLGITTRKTADTTASAETQAQISATNVATALSYAAVAAAGAAAAVASIPIVGPALAPAAAAGTFADTSAYAALAAFDKGTSLVPRDGIAMLHKNEVVLPPPQSDELRNALGRGRGRQNGDVNFHYAPQISAIDGPSVAGALRTHFQAGTRELNRQLRLMNVIQ